MFAMIRVPCSRSHGRSSRMKWSTPGFCRPTAFSMPPGASAMRGAGLPGRAFSVMPFDEMPPSVESG